MRYGDEETKPKPEKPSGRAGVTIRLNLKAEQQLLVLLGKACVVWWVFVKSARSVSWEVELEGGVAKW